MARRAFILEIAGVGHDGRPVRFYSGRVAPPTKIDTAGPGHTYLDVPGIERVHTEGATLDPRGGITETEPIVIELSTGRRRPRVLDPGVILGRHGPRAGVWVQLDETIPQALAAPDPIYVNADPAVLGTPPFTVHIGREVFGVNGVAGDGSPANRWRLTGTSRGLWGTVPSRHLVDALSSQQPLVVDRCVFWRTRRAILYRADIYNGRAMGPLVEVCRGFLEAQPVVEGNTVSLELIPNAAAVDRVLTAGRPTFHLAHGWHLFDGRTARYLTVAQGFATGHAWRELTTNPEIPNSGKIEMDTTRHAAVMDPTLSQNHPRRGAAEVFGRVYEVTGYNVGPPTSLAISAGPSSGIASGAIVGNPDINEAITLDVSGAHACIEWPISLFDTVNVAGGWLPGTHLGAGGLWADMALVALAEGGYGVQVTRNVPARERLRVLFWTSTLPANFGPAPIGNRQGGNVEPSRQGPASLVYAVDLAEPESTAEDFARLIQVPRDSEVGATYPIRGIADAFYQRSEKYITADGDLGLPAVGSFPVEVTYHDLEGEERTYIVEISDSVDEDENANALPAGVWGWQLTEVQRTAPDLPSFGDWPGRPRVTLRPTVRMINRPTAEVLLRLLTSNGGAQISSSFDVDYFGAGLPLADVDYDSFRAFAYIFDRWTIIVDDDETTMADLIDPILQLNGAALTMGVVDGRSVVRLVSVGLEAEAPVAHLTDADWIIRPAPEATVDSEIVNSLQIDADYDSEGKARTSVTRIDGASVEAHGEGRKMKIEARGLSLPAGVPPEQIAELRDAAAKTFQRLGRERLIWTASTTTRRGQAINVGDVVLVSSVHLRGFSDSTGVTAERARVMSKKGELSGEGCALTLKHTGARVAGFAASAEVLAIIDPVTVEVSVNRFTRPFNALGVAQYDIDGFVVDDAPIYEPRGANDAPVALPKILSTSTTTHRIVFVAAHGIAAIGGHLVQPSYDLATTRQKGYAYLADADGKLGAAADDGYEIV